MKRTIPLILITAAAIVAAAATIPVKPQLSIRWDNNFLTIHGDRLPGDIAINYLEAYCRPGSTDRDWGQTVIGHKTESLTATDDGRLIELRDQLNDGVVVMHRITASDDEVDFRLVAHNPTDHESQAHWAQPCIRVDKFTGTATSDSRVLVPQYARKCFIFLDGKLMRLPTEPWADKARYVPGQVYCPAHVNRDDVNPRPLSSLVPSNGLTGCFSADDRQIMAVVWEPYQELFQGVISCIHSDFRVGGLKPGETKQIRGKIYFVPADVAALVKRYERDFPDQVRADRARN